MAQLTKNARALLDQFAADLATIRHLASELDLAAVKKHPLIVADIFTEIDAAAKTMQRRLVDELEPMLQRQKANVDAAELAARIEAIEQQLADLDPQRKPIPIRKQESG